MFFPSHLHTGSDRLRLRNTVYDSGYYWYILNYTSTVSTSTDIDLIFFKLQSKHAHFIAKKYSFFMPNTGTGDFTCIFQKTILIIFRSLRKILACSKA